LARPQNAIPLKRAGSLCCRSSHYPIETLTEDEKRPLRGVGSVEVRYRFGYGHPSVGAVGVAGVSRASQTAEEQKSNP